MKRVMLFVAAMMIAAPALAQHVHEDAQAAPQAGPPAGAPGGGQAPQAPPIDVPWNDAIPGGNRRSRRTRAQGVAAPRRVGRHQDGRRDGC